MVIRVGFVSAYFSLFDRQMPPGFRKTREDDAQRFADTLGQHFEVINAGFLTDNADGDRANALLRDARPHVLVFAPSMAAPPSYGLHAFAGLEAPIVLWNAPTIDRLGSDLTHAEATVNSSQVACVMLGNALVRDGRPFIALTASPSDPAGVERLVRMTRAAAAGASLRGSRVLRVGSWLDGYRDVESTAEELAQLGVSEHPVSVEELNDTFASVSTERATALLEELAVRGWQLEQGEADDRSARLAVALADLAGRHEAACATVNCHSDFLRWNSEIGITACLGASVLTERGVPVSCTGDVPTALTLRLAQTMTGRSLYCEFYTPELETGLMLLAAGGEGDPAWADPSYPVRIQPNHYYPGEHGAGASLAFRLEPGPATALSLSPCPGGWRLAWATGEIVEARYDRMGGPNGMFRFDSGPADEAGARWIASGATHHNALAFGRLELEIPILAGALGVEAVRV